eukprot:scaffold5321_cov366-Prasinococcus_capsulatus_cf.AAC.10
MEGLLSWVSCWVAMKWSFTAARISTKHSCRAVTSACHAESVRRPPSQIIAHACLRQSATSGELSELTPRRMALSLAATGESGRLAVASSDDIAFTDSQSEGRVRRCARVGPSAEDVPGPTPEAGSRGSELAPAPSTKLKSPEHALGIGHLGADRATQGVQRDGVLAHQRHQDGDERCAVAARGLQVQQPFGECRRRGLHASFVRAVDLEVMPVRGVQAQQAAAGRAVLRVDVLAKVPPNHLCLAAAFRGELATPLHDEQRFLHHHGAFVALGIRRGRVARVSQRLELRLAVDTRELAALLQHLPDLP